MKVVKKPWGNFKQFTLNEISTVKILTVKPKQMLSLQKHKKRNEVWYFLTEGWVQINDKKKKMKKGETVKIRNGMEHRLFSKRKTVEVLEISFGKFDEKDIVRLEDKYNRT
jgi:mannose-6-phosphate isomerase-like protein (cupin superfamily)